MVGSGMVRAMKSEGSGVFYCDPETGRTAMVVIEGEDYEVFTGVPAPATGEWPTRVVNSAGKWKEKMQEIRCGDRSEVDASLACKWLCMHFLRIQSTYEEVEARVEKRRREMSNA